MVAPKPAVSADLLPIKLIMPKQGTEKRVLGGGGEKVPFRPVTHDYRASLSNQLSATQQAVAPMLAKVGAAPAQVRVLPKAAAKSHRPDSVFNDKTCPIVGAGQFGELFIKVTAEGVRRLNELITTNVSEQVVKDLSGIESIQAVTPASRRVGRSAAEILQQSPRRNNGFVTRVSLFDMGPGEGSLGLMPDFEALCEQHGIALDRRGYSRGTYAAECKTVEEVDLISRAIGVRSITKMPLMRTIRPKMIGLTAAPQLPARTAQDDDVPVVVVVDSGISDANADLKSWIVGRDEQVPKEYRNTDHGTFVAGLICFGNALNPTLSGIDAAPCAVFDLQVIPNDDPAVGDTSTLLENELLASLEAALQQHANKYKVWNLSLGSNAVCSLDEFSTLAIELDNLQEKYQVSFVISAGNYTTLPLLDYPRTGGQLEVGRITSPADSVLGIAVGSVSHVDFRAGGPKNNSPSAFSRHGAGPNYIIKPDLVHYGGSCSTDGVHLHGVRSLTAAGVGENLGTSFATPLVSRTLAQIYHQITPTPSPVLARALLTHHARDPRSGFRVPDGEENYLGFGMPAAVPYCLQCTPNSATLVFEDQLRPGYFLEWDAFPYPPSLTRGGRFFGEVWMTLAFAPTRGGRWGSEYCETHIDAHLGVYRHVTGRKTGIVSTKFAGLVPPEHKNTAQLHESFQVEKLRKWAPVRTYHGAMGENGERGLRWRLMLRLLARHDVDKAIPSKAQPFALIITIADPEGTAPVYNEMSQIVRNRFQAQNLAVRVSARVREQR